MESLLTVSTVSTIIIIIALLLLLLLLVSVLIIIIIIIRNLYSAIMPLGGYRGAEAATEYK